MMNNPTIYVTGGTGLVGSHLLYALCAQGKSLRASYRNKDNIALVKKVFTYYSSEPDSLLEHIEWVEADLFALKHSPELLEGISEFYHCAAMVSFESKNRKALLRNNIDGTACVVNACQERGNIRLCFVSSVGALGSAPEGQPVDESCHWKPSPGHSAYSISKFHSEMEVWRGISEGLEAVIVNPSIILGPGNWEKGSSALFHTLYKGLNYYTTGTMGYVDVRDVVQCMITLMDKRISNERFILNAENLSYQELFSLLARALGKTPPAVRVTPLMAKLAVLGARLGALLTRKPALITRESMQSAFRRTHFSNQKILNTAGVGFRPISQSISEIAGFYLRDRQ